MPHDDAFLPGAHASTLMKLRATSLEQYGIDPHALMKIEKHPLIDTASTTRSLAISKKEERALSVQEDHALIAL